MSHECLWQLRCDKIIFFILSTAELFWHSKLGLTTFKSCQMILRRTKVWSGLKLLETLQAVWLAVSALFYEFNCFTVGIDSSQKIVQPWAQWLKPIFFNQFDSVKIGRCSVLVSCYDFFSIYIGSMRLNWFFNYKFLTLCTFLLLWCKTVKIR